MTEEECNLYIDDLLSELHSTFPWSTSAIPTLIDVVRRIPVEIITNLLVLNYIEAFKMENMSDFHISVLANASLFTDDYKVLKLERNGDTHYTLITPGELAVLMTSTNHLRNTGMLPEDFRTRAEIEAEIRGHQDCAAIVAYLNFLGLITEEESSYIIPVPSETLNIEDTTARFSSAVWFEKIQQQTVILAGLGGIGSYVAFLLSRMHPKSLYMYDDDIVETVNLAGQMYGNSNIGEKKVFAMGRILSNMSSYNSAFCINERYTSDTQTSDVMICGFDNMEARKIFFNNWLQHVEAKPEEERKNCLFIDGRLAAEEFQVFGIRGDDTLGIIKYSREYLFSDDEADETLCSYKQTSYMANMIGSIMVNIFTNFVANSIADNIRELPFLTTYDGSTMMFKTID